MSKISEYPTGVTPQDADEFIVARSGDNRKLTWAIISSAIGGSSGGSLNLPEGTLINGRILPSVASNNLTVALKTFAGTDPSASDPVYIVIGGVARSITAALSVTKNAGTNFFSSGSAILAALERDYFAYIGYNATDGVVIGFSPIPYACKYSDFSTTNTDFNYCAISTITNAAADDNYVVIGRFAAILSASASFNWSVPTFTSANLIQRPIYNTRSLSWTPVVTASAGTPTTVTATCKYFIDKDEIIYSHNVDVVNKGTASGQMRTTVPINVVQYSTASGRENGSTGNMILGIIHIGLVCIITTFYDNTTLWVNTYISNVTIRGFLR